MSSIETVTTVIRKSTKKSIAGQSIPRNALVETVESSATYATRWFTKKVTAGTSIQRKDRIFTKTRVTQVMRPLKALVSW